MLLRKYTIAQGSEEHAWLQQTLTEMEPVLRE